ncbi:MAG: Flp pilus assembly complex ATPase component TadA [Bdellovibrionales bacterium]|nr:Flp pilus assembly complex ATPase component TadA [Bdellovibrionales bacterium]
MDNNNFIIAVSSGKGGAGKSTLAANLAISLHKELNSKALLIDLDGDNCGDLNTILGIRPTSSLQDVANSSSNIKTAITKHSSGLFFLPSVISPEKKLSVSSSQFFQYLLSLKSQYNFIIIDLGSNFSELQKQVANNSHAILLVTQADPLSITATKRKLNELTLEAVPREVSQIIVNQFDSKSALSSSAIEQNLQKKILSILPNDEISSYGALQSSTPFVINKPNISLSQSYKKLVTSLSGGLLQKLKNLSESGANTVVSKDSADTKSLNSLKIQIHKELIIAMNLKKDSMDSKNNPNKEQELKDTTKKVIVELTDKLAKNLNRNVRAQIIQEVLDEALGLGPLESLLKDTAVSEIMVNGYNNIYVERSGKLTLSKTTFTSNLQLRNVIERICTPLGRRIDEKNPYVDARLSDGSRVNAVIEPLSIDGPSLTIRKFPADRITVKDYTEKFSSLTHAMADFLKVCVEQGLNIIISGGTGSGKTTMLNVLSSFIPDRERIVTVEDAAELQLKQEHVVRLETRPANMEGTGEVSIRDLVKNCLRMRPDRIIVGECRDGAALDMISAMNTGHDGSMTTVHSNNPREAIARLETLCMMAGMDLPAKALREQISGAVDLIIQISRLGDGSRKIMYITEVVGMQGDTVTLQEIFRFKEEGFDKNRKIIGKFQSMGLIPSFIEKFEQKGIKIPRNLFTTENSVTSKPAVSTITKISSVKNTPTKDNENKSTFKNSLTSARPVAQASKVTSINDKKIVKKSGIIFKNKLKKVGGNG